MSLPDVLLSFHGKLDPSISLLALLILIVDIFLIVRILQSRKTLLVKIAWIAVIVFTGILGWILYFFLGREKR